MIRLTCAIACIAATTAAATPSRDDVCKWAPSKAAATATTTAATVGTAVGVQGTILALGATVVPHSSGATILTGSSGYVAGSMGLASSVPFITGTALVVVGAAALVEVGCLDLNHPDAVKSARQFYRDSPQRVYEFATEGPAYVLEKAKRLKRSVRP